jgi:succinoglycan biosynthesis transport protein ExoP
MKNFKNLDAREYFQIFWRRKWYFVITSVLVITGVTVYAFRLTQYYRSQTRFIVESALVPADYVRPIDRSTPQDRISAIRAQLETRRFLQSTIEQYQLYGFGTPGFSLENAIIALRGSLKVDVTSANMFTLSFYADNPITARDVCRQIADRLRSENVAARRNVTFETDQFVESQLSEAAAALENHGEEIKKYKTSHLGELPEQSAANLNILTGLNTQLASVEGMIDRAKEQQKLLEFRRSEQDRLGILTRNLISDPIGARPGQSDTTTAGPTNPLEQQLAVRRAQLAQLGARLRPGHPDYDALAREVRELEQKAAELSAAKKPAVDPGATSLTPLGAQANAGATGAATKTAADASTLPIDLASSEIRVEMEGIKDEIGRRERERGEILKQIKVVQGKLNLAPAIEQELMSLSRNGEALQRRYNELQTKKFNSQMANSLANDENKESLKIIDEANTPDRPSFPNRVQIILMGLGAGLFLGLAAAGGREYLDPTLGSEHEAAMVLQIPVLICIPEIPAHGRTGRRLLIRRAS